MTRRKCQQRSRRKNTALLLQQQQSGSHNSMHRRVVVMRKRSRTVTMMPLPPRLLLLPVVALSLVMAVGSAFPILLHYQTPPFQEGVRQQQQQQQRRRPRSLSKQGVSSPPRPSSSLSSLLSLSSSPWSLFTSKSNNDDVDDEVQNTGMGVGIDLGTTNSAIAFLDENNQPQIIEIPNNGRTIQSVVALEISKRHHDDHLNIMQDPTTSSGTTTTETNLFRTALVGQEAVQWERRYHETAYRHVKRIMGTGSTFISTETKQVVPHLCLGKAAAAEAARAVTINEGSGSSSRRRRKRPSNDDKKLHHKKKRKKTGPPSLQQLLDDAKENPAMLSSLAGGCSDVGDDADDDDDDDVFMDYHPGDGGDGPPFSSSSSSSSPILTGPISPETISSCIVQRLIDVAHNHTGRPVTRAVIGVPAYFNDAQRDATVRAAQACSGIEKVKLLREPEAAALAYGVDKQQQHSNNSDDEEELVLVFDLGGGTYDVSVLLVSNGLTEIVCTSGNAQLGGTNFDATIATYFAKLVGGCCKSNEAKDALVRAAEAVRIFLSNQRTALLALPLTEEGWVSSSDGKDVIVGRASCPNDGDWTEGGTNATHMFHEWTRKDMERLCANEFQALIKPLREVAIMAGALLPGDARPSIVESAIEMEAAYSDAEKFYSDGEDEKERDDRVVTTIAGGDDSVPMEVLDFASAKKMQQKGRRKARRAAKEERKYRAESRKVAEANDGTSKVQADGISGRPISRVVLVGGATRMPTIGRLISSLTGVVPQKTVDPDEAVALGCAVHVGVLDGAEGAGVVLNPMQAAILRAVAEKEQREGRLDDLLFGTEDDDDDDAQFANVEYF